MTTKAPEGTPPVETTTERPVQEKCVCNHPKSFHPDGKDCKAFGCTCAKWQKQKGAPSKKG